MMHRAVILLTLAFPFCIGAQDMRQDLRAQRALRQEQRVAKAQPPGAPLQRQRLEQQVRRQFWNVAKKRIGFTDEQMTKLEATSMRFDQRRKGLAQEERTHRLAMRAEIVADSSANQAALATALDQLQQVQRKRADMLIEEQKEYASFMTPLQRAKLFGLQEQIRKRMQELLRARPDSAANNTP
ncbi:MAG: hypothetical protein JWM95_5276 [Gemmatimonadetes bacterium]|nr:hypothetical protein [Gemmatimonadota bacterium]